MHKQNLGPGDTAVSSGTRLDAFGKREPSSRSQDSSQARKTARTLVAAKHAEIARRYAWQRKHKKPHYRSLRINMRKAELRALFRHRRGTELSKSVLDDAIFNEVGDQMQWKRPDLGDLLVVTFDEWKTLHLRTIAVCNDNAEQAKLNEHRRMQKRDQKRKERERQAARKQRIAANSDLSLREESLFDATDSRWRPLAELAKEIGNGDSWRATGARRRPLTGSSLRQAIKRAADRLQKQGSIESKIECGPHGEPHRVIRRVGLGGRL
jgi:hypothetical protein